MSLEIIPVLRGKGTGIGLQFKNKVNQRFAAAMVSTVSLSSKRIAVTASAVEVAAESSINPYFAIYGLDYGEQVLPAGLNAQCNQTWPRSPISPDIGPLPLNVWRR